MADDRKLITVRVSDQLHRELRLLAADRDVSLGELCASALQDWRSQRPEQVTVSTKATETTQNKNEQSTPKQENEAAPKDAGSVTNDPLSKAPRANKK